MIKQDWIASVLVGLLFVILVVLSGCNTARNVAERVESGPVSSLAIEYAAAKYVGADVRRAERVLEVVKAVRARTDAEAGPVVLAEIEALVRDAIRWDDLDAADRLAAHRLLEYVLNEVEREIGEGALDARDRMTIGRLLDLIESGVAIARTGSAEFGSRMEDRRFILTHENGRRVAGFSRTGDAWIAEMRSRPDADDKSAGQRIDSPGRAGWPYATIHRPRKETDPGRPTFPSCHIERGPPGGTGHNQSRLNPARSGKGFASAGPAALTPAESHPNGRGA